MQVRQGRGDGAGEQAGESADELAACLAAAQQGDERAFAVLYRELQPRLLRYAAGLVGTADGQDAEDVTAEAWLQIARDLSGFSGSFDSFRGWTARIVRNRALDQLRARARRPAQPTDVADLLDRADPLDAWTVTEERISTARALALIAELPPDQGEAVLLRAVVGLDVAAAAEVLGKRPGAVRVAAHRGLRALAKRLEKEGL